MITPFDNVIRRILERGYHNHRKAEHSDIASTGIWHDLLGHSVNIRDDHDMGRISHWLNQPAPDLQRRRADLLIPFQRDVAVFSLTRLSGFRPSPE